MNSKNVSAFLLVAVLILASHTAFAAAGGGDWVQPATSLVEKLESGLVKIGSVLVGVGVIIVGLYAACRLCGTGFYGSTPMALTVC
jgi:hypothetical protein